MKHETFTILPKFAESLITNSITFEHKDEEYTVAVSSTELEGLANVGDVFSFEQHRKAVNIGDRNPLEMCIGVNGHKYKKIVSLDLKLFNYRDRHMFLVIKGYDKEGRFILEIPLPVFDSSEFCRQLIYLFNQDKLYFHIFKDGAFVRHIVETNPFKDLKELEELFGRMDESFLYKEGDAEEAFKRNYEITNEFFQAYPKEYTQNLVMNNPHEHYFYLN